MKKDFFDALQEVYTEGGIGNTLMCQFFKNSNGGGESQFAKLAVYMEWKYGITCTKHIKTEHIYELLELLKENGFKDTTLKGYISAFRHVYKWNRHLFLESFEIPTNTEFAKWAEKRNT
ncbi:hypothetical protein ABD91_21520 [Lysinibacillus sphaericus]|uniref:site-specific integrase n=1 Tax=Lysinibacillus sphaericus TaxID=1421 RepID=UPI0018CD8DAC|nr:site-specific integrase [Lysinibacillus sphaericus]MBG9693318.1 hypothetical protein [Lysinibacillus sphaericus]